MFTGLIETVGQISEIAPLGDGIKLTVTGPAVLGDAKHGDSIAVNGVCLTVIEMTPESFTADVMRQTLNLSTLGALTVGDAVNLERAAALGSRLGGHIVQGHIDGTSTVLAVNDETSMRVVRFSLDRSHAPLVVDKGSITVNGVSLTVSRVSPAADTEQWFEVSLIPETQTATNLGALKPGDTVNIETDIMARHVARMNSFAALASSADSQETNPTLA